MARTVGEATAKVLVHVSSAALRRARSAHKRRAVMAEDVGGSLFFLSSPSAFELHNELTARQLLAAPCWHSFCVKAVRAAVISIR